MARRLKCGETLCAGLFLVAACSIMACLPLQAQTTAAPQADKAGKAPAYEVVSIKQDKSGNRNGLWRTLPEGFEYTNMPLVSFVYSAFGIIMDSQVTGLPEWVRSDPYDIQAKVDAETAEAWKKLPRKEQGAQEQLMMQSLLAERCQLRAHRETKELPVYDLVIAKGGLRMKEAQPNEAPSERMGGSTMIVRAQSIVSVVYGFAGTDGRLIVDKTGLGDKKFDFDLTWTPDNRAAADPADAGPSLFTALEEQLGLKLVPDKGPVNVLVIDHMERPSAN